MKKKIFNSLVCVLSSSVVLAAGAGETPKSSSQTAAPQTQAAKPSFDAAGKKIVFGSKTLEVCPSGFIRLMTAGKLTANFYIYADTPYSPWISNQKQNVTLPNPYGRNLGTDSVTADEKTQTITVKGKTPYHKKNEAEIVGEYLLTVRLLDSGKAAIHFEYTVPAKAEKGFMVMHCVSPGAQKFFRDGKECKFPENKKWDFMRKPGTFRVVSGDPAETFELTITSGNNAFAVPNKGFHISRNTPDKANPNRFVTDLEIKP